MYVWSSSLLEAYITLQLQWFSIIIVRLCSNFNNFLYTESEQFYNNTLFFSILLPTSPLFFTSPFSLYGRNIHWTHSCRRRHKRLVLQFPLYLCVCVCMLYVYTRRGSQFNVCMYVHTRWENSSGIWEKKWEVFCGQM